MPGIGSEFGTEYAPTEYWSKESGNRYSSVGENLGSQFHLFVSVTTLSIPG